MPLTSLDTEVRRWYFNQTSVTGIKYKEIIYSKAGGNKVHKTTKKYLNLGISQTDCFLKGENYRFKPFGIAE